MILICKTEIPAEGEIIRKIKGQGPLTPLWRRRWMLIFRIFLVVRMTVA